jgi:uncharacterized protein (TIGR00369 family)
MTLSRRVAAERCAIWPPKHAERTLPNRTSGNPGQSTGGAEDVTRHDRAWLPLVTHGRLIGNPRIPSSIGPTAVQIVSRLRDSVGSFAIRRQSIGSTGRSSCDAGTMATAPEYGDFALKHFLGLEIETVASGRARAQITIADEHRNPNGVVHGAVYFAMVDTAMGAATMSALSDGRFCTSVEVQLRFIRPAANGVLIADVSVVKMGRNIVHLEARVHDGDERLIATGGGTFAIIGS